MKFFIPAATNKEQEERIKKIITDRTIQYFHTEPSSWYRSISFQKEGRFQQAITGEKTAKIYGVHKEPIIAIVSVPGTYLVYTLGRGIEAWPPIMIGSFCIRETEPFDFPGQADEEQENKKQ